MARCSTASSLVAGVVVVALSPAAGAEPASASVSCGSANRGGLGNPVELERSGPGYRIPELWWERGRRYGTAELVALIADAAARVAGEHPGSILGVADLSDARGGAISHHQSHQSGRDVDLIYYATDAGGRPLPPGDFMPRYGSDGRADRARTPVAMELPELRHFDRARNWALVVALVTSEVAEVERMFVSRSVYRWLLAEAAATQTPASIIAAVLDVLRVDRRRQRHADHIHVRVRCTAEDIRLGLCRPHLAPRRRRGRKWRWGVRCPR